MALVVLVAGQPLITSDVWWHLALGRAYAAEGPWLSNDPLLFTAPGPPTPAAWLWDLGLHGVEVIAGFTGLRVLHAALVLAALALALSLFRRASGSWLIASAATALLVVLSAYRLAQLRPHLATWLAALSLYRLLLESGKPPTVSRIAIATVLMALWANLHAGFLLGPALLAGAAAGLVVFAPLRPPGARAVGRQRTMRLALAAALGLAATLANPAFLEPHRAWFVAGSETPMLARVIDEWTPVSLLRQPIPKLPPSPLAWGVLWLLALATPLAALRALRGWRRPLGAAGSSRVDPALVALALGGLLAPFVAVRFLWLGFLPLLLLAASAAELAAATSPANRGRAALATALALALLVPGFLRLGDWPMVGRSVPRGAAGWAVPYRPASHFAHATWMLADAGVAGNAYNDYAIGGFLGYWLAPELRAYLNGTLNVTPEVMQANLPIRERRGVLPGETFLELLDRFGIEVFVGIHPPQVAPGARPWYRTTAHLEGAPGWLPVFRNLRSAIYLRDTPRNAANLERIAAWYRQQEVPFEAERGFDAARVVREAPDWAVRHGLVKVGHRHLGPLSVRPNADGARALEELALTYAGLGLYERCVHASRARLRRGKSRTARRLLVWGLLQLGRAEEARAAAAPLTDASGSARDAADALTRAVAGAAERYPTLDPEQAAALRARLPVLNLAEVARLLSGTVQPAVRPPRALGSRPSAGG